MLGGGAIEPYRIGVFDKNGEGWHRGAGRGHRHEARPEACAAVRLREGFAWLVEGGLGYGVVLRVELELYHLANSGCDGVWGER